MSNPFTSMIDQAGSKLSGIIDAGKATASKISGELSKLPSVDIIRSKIAAGITLPGADGEMGPPLPPAGDVSLPSTEQLSDELASLAKRAPTAKKATDTLIKPNTTTIDFKAKLVSKQNPRDLIVFKVSPNIDESRSANYEHLQPAHHPGTIQIYKSTDSRQFNVSAKFISRTSAEASENLTNINLLRSWVMPYYGQGTAASHPYEFGGPPDVLHFSVYGEQNIRNIPVVVTSYHWVYPDTVDYIPSLDGTPFPTIFEITISLVESFSPEEFTKFDIAAYKKGDLAKAYSFGSNPQQALPTPDSEGFENLISGLSTANTTNRQSIN